MSLTDKQSVQQTRYCF